MAERSLKPTDLIASHVTKVEYRIHANDTVEIVFPCRAVVGGCALHQASILRHTLASGGNAVRATGSLSLPVRNQCCSSGEATRAKLISGKIAPTLCSPRNSMTMVVSANLFDACLEAVPQPNGTFLLNPKQP